MAISHVVAPVDFSPASRRALDQAIEIASACGARLDIIHAIEQLTYRGVAYSKVMATGTIEETREQAAEDLEEWADIARQQGVETRSTVVDGDGRSAIVQYAGEHGADLVVVGAKGHSRLHDLVVGSVATAVVQRCPCSVYVAR
jgi:nucleotide-binding universal stress UspA family protein